MPTQIVSARCWDTGGHRGQRRAQSRQTLPSVVAIGSMSRKHARELTALVSALAGMLTQSASAHHSLSSYLVRLVLLESQPFENPWLECCSLHGSDWVYGLTEASIAASNGVTRR